MKTMKQPMKGLGLVAGLLLAVSPPGVFAAGTDAGVTVTNSVTLDFEVNSVAQTQQTTDIDFAVDRKLVLTVTNDDGDEVTNSPNATDVGLQFTVTNTSNGTADAYLTAVSSTTGTTSPYGAGNDDIDTNNVAVYSDATCATPIAKLDDMNEGQATTVYICSDIPGAAVDADIAVLGLVAEVGEQGGATALGTDDAGTDKNANLTTVYSIFAETSNAGVGADTAQFDGAAASLGAYLVQAASLTLAKTVTVVDDPTTSTTPHAIPGATMEYTLTVENAAGAQDATSIDIQDVLPGTLTYVTGSMAVNTSACADASGTVNLANGSTATCDNQAAPTPKVSGFTVGAGETVTITYQATIN